MSGILFWLLFSSAQAESLSDYLERALSSNPEIQAKKMEIQIAEAQANQAGFLPDPRIMIGGAISPIETRLGPQQGRVSVSQQLPWFGTLRLQEEMFLRYIYMENQEFREVVLDVWYRMTEIWINLIEQEMILVILNKNSEILNVYHKIMLQKYQQARKGLTDVLMVEMQIEKNSLKKQIVIDKIEFQKKRFFLLLGEDNPSEIVLPFELTAENIPEATSTVYPRLQWYDEKLEAIEIKEKIIKKQIYPSIHLGVDYVLIGNMSGNEAVENGRDAIIPMLGLSLPIYQQKNKAKKDEIIIQKQMVKLKKQSFVNEYQTSLEEQRFIMSKNQDRMASIETQIQLEQKRLTLLEQDFQVSGRGFEQLLKKQEDILELQLQKITYEKEYCLAQAKHNQLSGVYYVDF